MIDNDGLLKFKKLLQDYTEQANYVYYLTNEERFIPTLDDELLLEEELKLKLVDYVTRLLEEANSHANGECNCPDDVGNCKYVPF